jgi:hypothetical protein
MGRAPSISSGLACLALLAIAPGCGGPSTTTVTVQGGPPARTSTAATGRVDTLSRQDSQRIARARAALADYCEAVRAGSRPNDDPEVAALAVMIAIFIKDPAAVFTPSDPTTAFADLLRSEADALERGNCDRKGAKLLRNAVELGLYRRSRLDPR